MRPPAATPAANYHLATVVPDDVAAQFRALCRAEDRSVSSGLRQLINQRLAASNGAQNGQRPDWTPVVGETSTDAIGRDRVPEA